MTARRWLSPLVDFGHLRAGLSAYVRYVQQWRAYARLPQAESLRAADAYPCLFDRTPDTAVDAHYFHQGVWAFKAVQALRPAHHVDVGSLFSWVGLLTSVTDVTFIDIRPPNVHLPGLTCRAGSVLDMPYDDGALPSISCLHVAEHVGLGRYGDELDPLGTRKAAKELTRVLSPGGHLLFSLPVGRPRVCFNAHRIHAPQQVLDYFADLSLAEFAGVDDRGEFRQGILPKDFADQRYACGFFRFVKPAVVDEGRA